MWCFPLPSAARSHERELRRRVRRLLRRLDIQPPLSAMALCRAVARERGHSIEFQPYPLPARGPHGLWIKAGPTDVILYQQHATRVHREHILLHELGHILAARYGRGEGQHWNAVIPALGPRAIARVLETSPHRGPAERRDAELIASIIGEWASVLDEVLPPGRPGDPSGQRVREALGCHGGWQ